MLSPANVQRQNCTFYRIQALPQWLMFAKGGVNACEISVCGMDATVKPPRMGLRRLIAQAFAPSNTGKGNRIKVNVFRFSVYQWVGRSRIGICFESRRKIFPDGSTVALIILDKLFQFGILPLAYCDAVRPCHRHFLYKHLFQPHY